MSGWKNNISLIIILGSIFCDQASSQQINYRESLNEADFPKVNFKPGLVYSIGSSFMSVPHIGYVTGFTLSPSLTLPLSPKLSFNGGIIAGRYYSNIWKSDPEGAMNGAFNELSVYGSVSYSVNPQLTLYSTGIRRLTGDSPLYSLPKSSYTIGSSYDFGDFSIGVTFQMSEWDNLNSPYRIDGSLGGNSLFEQRWPSRW